MVEYNLRPNLRAYEFFKFLEQTYCADINYVKGFSDMSGGANAKFNDRSGIDYDVVYNSGTACASVDAKVRDLLAHMEINFKNPSNVVINIIEQKCADELLEIILEKLTPNGFKLEPIKAQ